MDKTAETYTGFVTSRVVKTHNGYGLFIICGDGEGRIYPDLSCDLVKLSLFSDKLNEGRVSALHIDDIIEDMLE